MKLIVLLTHVLQKDSEVENKTKHSLASKLQYSQASVWLYSLIAKWQRASGC